MCNINGSDRTVLVSRVIGLRRGAPTIATRDVTSHHGFETVRAAVALRRFGLRFPQMQRLARFHSLTSVRGRYL